MDVRPDSGAPAIQQLNTTPADQSCSAVQVAYSNVSRCPGDRDPRRSVSFKAGWQQRAQSLSSPTVGTAPDGCAGAKTWLVRSRQLADCFWNTPDSQPDKG